MNLIIADKPGFLDMLDAVTRFAGPDTYAQRCGEQLQKKHAKVKVAELVSVLDELKAKNEELYRVIVSYEASGNLDMFKPRPETAQKIPGIPNKIAAKLSQLSAVPADLQISGLNKQYVRKMETYGTSFFHSHDTVDEQHHLFEHGSVLLEADQKTSWNDFLKPYKHKTKALQIIDSYILNDIPSLVDFISGIAMGSRSPIALDIITKQEDDELRMQRAIASLKAINIPMQLTLYTLNANAPRLIHDRTVLSDQLLIDIGGGIGSIRNGKAYRSTTMHIIGKYYKNGQTYRKRSTHIAALKQKATVKAEIRTG
jgi:hypothetical protein